MLSPEQQAEFIDRVLKSWAKDAIGELQSALKERLGYVPSETLNVIKFQLFKAATGNPARATLAFQDSGRINEMRRVEFRRAPITTEENFILKWLRKRPQYSRTIPGYESQSRVAISKEKQLSRVASAIIFSKVGKIVSPRSRKKRQWYNTEFYSQTEILVKRLIREQSDFLLEQIKDATIESLQQ